MSYIPDRKVMAGGVGGVAAWGATLVMAHYGITITPDMAALIVGAVGWLVAYVVPPSARDIIKRLNDNLVQMAAADPNIPVTVGPPKTVTQIIDGAKRAAPVLLACVLVLGLAACNTTSATKPEIAAAAAAPQDITAQQKWEITCQFADGAYLAYLAFAKPAPGDDTAVKVAAGYEAVKVVCSARPENYATALITLMQAFNAFKAAIPPKVA